MQSQLSIGGDLLKNRLEELRKAHDIKQEELAEMLEVSRQTIGSLEMVDTIHLYYWLSRFLGILDCPLKKYLSMRSTNHEKL